MFGKERNAIVVLLMCCIQLGQGAAYSRDHAALTGMTFRSLTCVTPATSKSIGKAHNIRAEHDTGPELTGNKACQSPANKKPGYDVASSCVHGCNSKNEGGRKHQEEGICCSTQTPVSTNIQEHGLCKEVQLCRPNIFQQLRGQPRIACTVIGCVGETMLTISRPKLVARLTHEHANHNSSRSGDHTCSNTWTIVTGAT